MIPASNEHLRTPLGTLILRAGLLSEEQIADALREGERSGRRLGEILVQRGLLGSGDLARMLARQMGLAFVLLEDQPFDRHAVRLISEDLAVRDRVLPYRFESGVPLVAIADPTTDVVKANLHEALKREFRLTVTTDADLTTAIARAYGRQAEQPEPHQTLGIGGAPIRTSSVPLETPSAAISAPTPSPEVFERPSAPAPPLERPAEPVAASPAETPSPPIPAPEASEQPSAPAPPVEQPVAPPPSESPSPAPAEEEAPQGVVVPLWDGPLGALLVSSELLSSEQVEDALREAAKRGRRLGEIVVERGWIHERTLANCLAGQKGLPFISLSETAVDRSALHLLPEEIALRYGALPIGFEGGALKAAIADPTNEAAMESIRAAVDVEIRFVVAAPSELASAIAKAYDPSREATAVPAVEHEPVEAHPPIREPEPLDVALRESIQTATTGTRFKVEVCLSHGERVDAGEFPDRAAAETRAKELVRQIAGQDPTDWPFVNGRFLRPTMIVSVDLAEASRPADEPLPTENLG